MVATEGLTIMLDDALTKEDELGAGGWIVAGVMTDLAGALLTTQTAEAGLAGTVELDPALADAANDANWQGARHE